MLPRLSQWSGSRRMLTSLRWYGAEGEEELEEGLIASMGKQRRRKRVRRRAIRCLLACLFESEC